MNQETLQRGWNKNLGDLFKSSEKELMVSSPYVSETGIDFLIEFVPEKFKANGNLRFITDLSPKNITQGSTNPNAFKKLFQCINSIQLFHLPRLHAKVYVNDRDMAIVTSGNLTAGGIYNNFEYGIFVKEKITVSNIQIDLSNYSSLGALIGKSEIENYCQVSEELKSLISQKERSIKREFEKRFKDTFSKANDELIKARLSEGSLHAVFEKTILYILQKNGPLPTVAIHNQVEKIHPDLCDNNVDRVINGVRFGKKWKHAVRTAQQHLKKKGVADLIDGNWTLIR